MIAIACDHGGRVLKDTVSKYLLMKGLEFKDFGIFDDAPADYPDLAALVAKEIQAHRAEYGILVCGTGIGMSIAANKHNGIRAAVACDAFSSRAARAHNDANVLCLGERVLGSGLALDIVDAFLSTPFEGGGRHSVRVGKIENF